MSSLRSRLVIGVVVTAMVTIAATSFVVYSQVRRSLVAQLDHALLGKAQLLASTVEAEGDRLDLEFQDLDMAEFTGAAGGYLQLFDDAGASLYRSPSLGDADLEAVPWSASSGVGFQVARWALLPGAARGRSMSYTFVPRLERSADEATPRRALQLVIARDAAEVQAALSGVAGRMWAVGMLATLVAGAILALGVGRALRPLSVVSSRISTIGEDDLSVRLPSSGVPAELVPVALRLNELLSRLEAAFTRERAFASAVAHELRTPLAGLRATLDVALARPRASADYHAALRDSSEIAGQLQSLVDRLLELARLECSRSAPQRTVVVLAQAAVEAWAHLAARAGERSLKVSWDLPADIAVRTDPGLVDLILRNLFSNAVTHADPGGRVHIGLGRGSAGGVTVRVENTGCTLNEDEAQLATQRLWRGEASRNGCGDHFGLGLSIVQRATIVLEGRLELHATRGQDFVASVWLPEK